MWDWFFAIIILVCAAVIAYIIYSKLPQLANLDVSNLPTEKIARRKRALIVKRIESSSVEMRQRLIHWLLPGQKYWRRLQLRFRIYVGQVERLLYHEQTARRQTGGKEAAEEGKQKFAQLLQSAEQYLQTRQYDRAEEAFIAALKIDARSSIAYRGLGDTYFAKGSLEEARETYRFVSVLEPDDDNVLVRLAEIAEGQGNTEEAIDYYQRAAVINDALSPRFYHLAELLLRVNQPSVAKEAAIQAVELEPQNPKYLDLLAEIAILCRDKALAQQNYEALRLVNPENQKLEDFRERIGKLK